MDRDGDGRLPATGLWGLFQPWGRKILRSHGLRLWRGRAALPSLGCAGVLALSGGIPGASANHPPCVLGDS